MPYMLLIVEDPAQRATRTEAEGHAVYGEAKAGVLLDGAGLHDSAGDRRTVTDGPFAESKELIAGYTLIQVRSREEALELNRAVAVAMAFGPEQGLAIVDALRDEPTLKGYQWLPSGRADLLAKLGRNVEARAEFEQAAALAGNTRERELLLQRAVDCGGSTVVPAEAGTQGIQDTRRTGSPPARG